MGLDKLDRNAARKLISRIRTHGVVNIWDHCEEQMLERDIDAVDLDNVLRCGTIFEEPELHKSGNWRYRVQTQYMLVVIQFDGENELSAVTAWRIKR